MNITAVAAATATFAMAQLGASRRIYQRSTKTGGGASKGQGLIAVTISSASAGTINARCRSIDGANTILQPEWQAATIANGATTATIAGVDARLGWFFLDLKDSSGSWKLGTVPVGMGRLIAVAGQSLMVCMLSRYVDNATSIATAGASINDNGRVLASNDSTTTASGWQQFVDQANAAGVHNSAGGAELLDRQIARFGVNCGLIGNAKGGSDIGSWQSGQTNFTELARVIALAGGAFEAGWWFQGHTPTISPTDGSYIGRTTAITSFMASFKGLSTLAPQVYITTMPNQTDTSGTNAGFPGGRGNWNVVYQVNRADAEWCAINGGIGVPFSDLTLTDNTHPDQASTRRQANHFDRATAAESGGANDNGPVVTAMTKSGVNLICTVSQTGGGTSLIATGAPGGRMRVTTTNGNTLVPLALDATTPITVDSATQFTLKLASDPGDVNIELWPMGLHLTDAGAANVIRDNVTGAFGEGRQLRYAPVPVLRKSTAGALSTSGISFAAGKFGNGRSNGEMKTAAKLLPSWPWDGCALECWFTYSTALSATTALVMQVGTMGIYADATNILLNVGGNVSSGVAHGMTPGNTYHLRIEYAPVQSKQWVYVNGVSVGTLTTTAAVGTSNLFAVGGNGTGGGLLGTKGVIDEVAYWHRQLTKGANFTPSTSAYADGDPNGPAFLWHLNGDGAESGWAG